MKIHNILSQKQTILDHTHTYLELPDVRPATVTNT